MRIDPLIEVELDGVTGSAVDYREACGFEGSAVCEGVLVELMLVASREMGFTPVTLSDVSLSGHAAIGDGLRLVGRGYERSIEVVSGPLQADPAWPSTHSFAALPTTRAPSDRGSALRGSALRGACSLAQSSSTLDSRALEHVRRRAGGSAIARPFILELLRDSSTGGVRILLDPHNLADANAYALHPLLWEAALAAAELVGAPPGGSPRPVRSGVIRARSVNVSALGAAVREIRVLPKKQCTNAELSMYWLDEAGQVVAEVDGLDLNAGGALEPAERRCVRIVERTLGKQITDVNQPLTELGVSSIDRARVAAALATDYGYQPTLSSAWACETLAALARLFGSFEHSVDAELAPGDSLRSTRDRMPLTAAQRQVWALHAMAPETPRCHIHVRLDVDGDLKVERLRAVLAQLIERHPSLRTVLDARDVEPFQHVLAAMSIELETIVARDEGALLAASKEHAERLFDLERGPLARFSLIRVAPFKHAVLITLHHMIADGFSVEILVRELAELYADLDAFDHVKLGMPYDASPYDDHATRPSAIPAGDGSAGVFPRRDPARRLDLARDKDSLGEVRPGRGARIEIACESELAEALRTLAHRQQVSLFALLCAAYSEVLSRHVGQDDLVLGVVSVGRKNLSELNAVGMFARSVPLRMTIERSRTLLSLAHEINAQARAITTADASMDDPRGDHAAFSATMLFQQWSTATIESVVPAEPGIAGDVEPVRWRLSLDSPDGAPEGFCRSDLELVVGDFGTSLSVALQYDVNVLRAETVQWLAGALQRTLKAACVAPESALRDLAAVDVGAAAGTAGPMEPLSGTAIALDETLLAHDLIVRRAAQAPEAIAVRDITGRALTYAELSSRAHAAAAALRQRGVGPGSFIAIVAERSCDLPVALLAVLKSGAAYVPIDPAHPRARVLTALEDTGAKSALTLSPDHEWTSDLVALGVECVMLDTLVDEGRSAPQHWPASSIRDAAYVLHTSGSTGRPKGVRIEHGNLLNFVRAMDEILPDVARRPWLALTTLAFDISVVELVYSLTRGAEVHVGATPSLRSGDSELFSFLRSLGQGVRCFQCTPSLARILLEDADGRAFLGGLDALLVGGEAMPLWLARAIGEVMEGELWNMYGPTETTVWSSAARVFGARALWSGSRASDPARDPAWISIGRPLANTTFHIFDELGHAVPRGLAGELCIGGLGVATGYLGRAEETAARFVVRARPKGDERMYRTGDLVRLRASGELEWLGRLDRQVKILGNRVELADVEGVLAAHAMVLESAVLTDVDRLVAFIVPRDAEAAVDLEEAIVDWARQRLPSYMVPGCVMLMRELPRTTSGKTDYAALATRAVDPVRRFVKAPPRTAREIDLAELWADVLSIDDIGRHDDFFALGGSSFSATVLVARARRRNFVLSPALIYRHPTLAEQAAALDDAEHLASVRDVSGSARARAAAPTRNVELLGRPLDVALDGPVQSAALATIPDSIADELRSVMGDAPVSWVGSIGTPWGKIALLLLPVADAEIYDHPQGLLTKCEDAIAMARGIGAAAVSLTGLIPSATSYGRALIDTAGVRSLDAPIVTTGHATTCAAVVITLQALLRGTRRSIEAESLACLGVGSIGAGVVRLLLALGLHPKSIVLSDVSRNLGRLKELAVLLRETFNYRGAIALSTGSSEQMRDVYRASVIVGATNVPAVLDIARLARGCLVVDDSAPHCFDIRDAIERMQSRGDVICVQGGALGSPRPLRLTFSETRGEADRVMGWLGDAFGHDEREIMGCTLSSLMTATTADLGPTSGEVDVRDALKHHAWVLAQGLTHAPFRLKSFSIPEQLLSEVSTRHEAARPLHQTGGRKPGQ